MICVVGEDMSRDTPDPIPNSEVKSWQPMILLSGKVGYCQLFQPPVLTDWGLSFLYNELAIQALVKAGGLVLCGAG